MTKVNPDSPQHDIPQHDPMEAIYALNIGDFVAESFISDELLGKISDRLGSNPDKLRAQLEELVEIYAMDKTLSVLGFENTDGFVIYDSIASTLQSMFQTDACHIFQVAQKDSGEQYLSLTGTSCDVTGQHRWELGIQLASLNFLSDVVRGYDVEVVEDVKKLPNWRPIKELGQDKTVSVLACPMNDSGKPQGLLVFESRTKTSFSEELKLLAENTGQIMITSTRLQQLVSQVQIETQKETPNNNTMLSLRAQITESIADLGIHQQAFISALADAIDARNHYSHGHSKKVAHVSRAIGEALQLNEKTLDLIQYAGMLGALGKVHIPGDMLAKKDKLSNTEWDELRNHPNVGVSLLGKINFLSETIPYVQSQKEHWDGSGSPEGLKGRSIPLGARILALADAYYAMTSERPYRDKTMSHDEAVALLQKEAGSKWEPLLVDTLAGLADKIAEDDFL